MSLRIFFSETLFLPKKSPSLSAKNPLSCCARIKRAYVFCFKELRSSRKSTSHPDDFVATENAINHIGVCYQINSNNYDMLPHFIEKMQPLENRIMSSPQNLDKAWRRKQKADSTNIHDSYTTNCPGFYPVSGYTRDDGTKVDSYIRTCYLHGG